MAQEWYYTDGERKVGPVSAKELKQAAVDGILQPTTLVWSEGMKGWKEARTIKGLAGLWASPLPVASPAPPPLPARRAVPVAKTASEPSSTDLAQTEAAAVPSLAQQPWLIGLSFLCCFPAGLLLVWLHPRVTQTTKWVVTAVVGVFVLVMAATSSRQGDPSGGGSKPGASGTGRTAAGVEAYRHSPSVDDDAINRLLQSDDFIRTPPGASRTPDERLTEDYYPHEPGAEVTVAKYSLLVKGRIDSREVEADSGLIHTFTTRMGELSGGRFRVMKETPDGEEPDPPQERRVRDGYVEVGMQRRGRKGGKPESPTAWTPWVKVGASAGDSWSATTNSDTRMTLLELFSDTGRKYAVVREVSRISLPGGKGFDMEVTRWFVKGVGPVRMEHWVKTDGGPKELTTREVTLARKTR